LLSCSRFLGLDHPIELVGWGVDLGPGHVDLALDTGDGSVVPALHIANFDVPFLLADWEATRYACSETVRLDHLLVRFQVVLLAGCVS